MDEIVEFFKGLFDTKYWPARWHCGYWTTFHGYMYIVSDLLIWAAYFLMPVLILQYFRKKKTGLKFRGAYVLFAAFILLCGATHFLDALMFYTPVYRFNALVRFVTGVVSMFTVYYLFKVLPEAFKARTTGELEIEVEKRKEAERKLAEANRGLQAFAYVASHDLQEPLRKIKTFSSMLAEANADKYDEKSREYSAKVITSTTKMQQLIKDVLSLSELNHEISLDKVNIVEAINRAKEDLEVKISERNAVVNVGFIPPVKGNPTYLYQLFLNLISNSLKFSERAPTVNILGETRGDKVVISVRDNGIGMEASDVQKIFDAFTRLNAKAKYEGSGIGLAICKRIVEIHDGKISATSNIGEGTTFTIELPAA